LLLLLAGTLAAGFVGVTWKWLEANEQRSLANNEKQTALREAYRARLAVAAAALQNHDVADAARHLAFVPEALRGWEWRHLHSRLDDSSAVIPTQASAIFLSHGTDGLRLIALADQRLRVLDEQGHTERTWSFPHENVIVWTVAQAPEGLLLLDR